MLLASSQLSFLIFTTHVAFGTLTAIIIYVEVYIIPFLSPLFEQVQHNALSTVYLNAIAVFSGPAAQLQLTNTLPE